MNSSTFNKRLHKLEKIYNILNDNGLIECDEDIDIKEIMENLYFLNLLIYKSYEIFNLDKRKKKKIKKLSELETPEGNTFLDTDTAEKIFNMYSNSLTQTIDKIKRNREKMIKYNEQYSDIESMKGGYNEDVYGDNKIDELLQSFKGNKKIENQVLTLAQSLKSLSVNTTLTTKDVASTISGIKSVALLGPRMMYNSAEYMFNWVFFPIYQLQSLPVIGSFVDIPLDIIGMIIDNSDIIMEFMGPLLPVILDLITKVIGMIPLAGSVSSAIGIALMFVEPALTWVLTDGTDFLGLFLNIQRKEWGLAYTSALEIIPNMPSIMDAVLTNMTKTNKYLYKIHYVTDTVEDITDLSLSVTDEFLQYPLGFLKPLHLWNKVIYPNRKKIPLLNKVPFEKFNKIVPYVYLGYNMINDGIKQSKLILNNSLDIKKVLKHTNLNASSLLNSKKLLSNSKNIKDVTKLSQNLSEKYNNIEKDLFKAERK